MAAQQRHTSLVRELTRSHVQTLVVLVLVLVLSVASSGYLILLSQPRQASYVAMARDARDGTEAMLNQETGLRGWLSTGDAVFLEPYTAGKGEAESALGRLATRSRDDDAVSGPVAVMLAARARWGTWADQAATMRVSDEQRMDGRLAVFLLEGKGLFDRYRAANQITTRQIRGQQDVAVADQRLASNAALVAYLALLLAGGLVTVRRWRGAREAVVRPIGRLLATIDALGDGDLTVRSRRSGVHELDAVGSALDTLAGELAEARGEAAAREARLGFLAEQFETVTRVGREIAGSLSIRYVSATVASACADLVGAPTTVWVHEQDEVFHPAARSTDQHGTSPQPEQPSSFVETVAAERSVTTLGGRRGYPLELGGVVVGVLEMSTPRVDDDTERVLLALLSTAAAALESARLHSDARERAETDALTGLPNRRRFESDISTEWQRAFRYDRPLSLIMVDLDHFKRLNDRHGHLFGDQALRTASQAVVSALRSLDTAYRYGGEEIAVLLRETELDEAVLVAERLRLAVAATTFDDPSITVTASAGVAQLRADMTEHTDLVGSADAALYRAKRTGRNKVEPSPAAPALRRSV